MYGVFMGVLKLKVVDARGQPVKILGVMAATFGSGYKIVEKDIGVDLNNPNKEGCIVRVETTDGDSYLVTKSGTAVQVKKEGEDTTYAYDSVKCVVGHPMEFVNIYNQARPTVKFRTSAVKSITNVTPRN